MVKDSLQHRALAIFNLLAPACAKHYSKGEAKDLFLGTGFSKVDIYH